jgi:putative sigma-54 modulation protein
MRVTYTGRQVELAPAQLRKIEAGLAKIGKLLDGKEEKEAHVVLSLERHLHNSEITIDYYDHRLVGAGSGPDLFTAMHAAIEKLEKQAVKVRERWRDLKRVPRKEAEAAPAAPEVPEAEEGEAETPQVFRVNHHERRKPMTLDEALMEMEKDLDYLVYVDAETDQVAVLIRRRDGNFDLVEA